MPGTKLEAAQRHSKKSRSVRDAGEPLLAGEIYRGSHVVPDCVKQRHAVVFKDKFGTYDRNGATGKSERKKRRLDKVWVFAAHHRLTPIKRRKFSAVENHKKHSLLSALTSDHYVEKELFTFTLKSELAAAKGSGVLFEKLDIAFDSNDEAVKWRDAIADQIGEIRRRDGAADADLASSEDGEPGSAVAGVAEARRENGNGSSPSSSDGASAHGSSRVERMATPTGASRAPSTTDDEDLASLQARTSSVDILQRELGIDTRVRQGLDDWKVVTCESSITVLRGTEQHNAASIMLSYIIRASPRLCVKTLLNRNEQKLKVDSLNLTFKVVEIVDAFNDVLEATWQPRGFERYFMAPRMLRVRRLWRREDDGTYVVMFRAIEPQEAAPHPAWWAWYSPVSCKLIDTCYTFSPLTGEYSREHESGETLVTQVSCYGDLGGWLARSHPFKRLLDLVAPLSANSWTAFIRPHIESSIAIRNRAESDRFCSRPFLESHDEGTSASLHAAHHHGYTPGLRAVHSGIMMPPQSEFARSAETSRRSMAARSASHPDGDTDPGTPGGSEANGHADVPPDASPADVATCDRKYWSCPGANNLKVRGANYLKDRKKISAQEPVFALAATDLLQVEKPTLHIARFLPSLKASRSPFTFIMQIMFGSPSLSLTFSWAAPEPLYDDIASPVAGLQGLPLGSPAGSLKDESEFMNKPFELTLARFLAGGTNDEEANHRRNGVLKLIPRISQGAWFVKQAVGTTPCLLGRKLKTHFHRGPRYFEVDLDVSSSSVAANIVGLVQGLTKSLCVDMAIVLEGHTPQELPESLLGTVRCSHLDLNAAKLLDVETGEITEKPQTGKNGRQLTSLQTAPAHGNKHVATANASIRSAFSAKH